MDSLFEYSHGPNPLGACVDVKAFAELAKCMPAEHVLEAFRVYCDVALAALSNNPSVVSDGVDSGASVYLEKSDVSVNSSVSSARAQKRARWKKNKLARAASAASGASSVTYAGDQGEKQDGYCYLDIVAGVYRDSVRTALGPYPTLGRLLCLPRDQVLDDLSEFGVTRTSSGVLHIARTGMVPLLHCLASVVQASADKYPNGTLGADEAMRMAVPSVLRRKVPGIDTLVGGASELQGALWSVLTDRQDKMFVIHTGEDTVDELNQQHYPVMELDKSAWVDVPGVARSDPEFVVNPKRPGILRIPCGVMLSCDGFSIKLTLDAFLVLRDAAAIIKLTDLGPRALAFLALDVDKWAQLDGMGIFPKVANAYRLATFVDANWIVGVPRAMLCELEAPIVEAISSKSEVPGAINHVVPLKSLETATVTVPFPELVLDALFQPVAVGLCGLLVKRPIILLPYSDGRLDTCIFRVSLTSKEETSLIMVTVHDNYEFDGGGPSEDESVVSDSEYMRYTDCAKPRNRSGIGRWFERRF